MTIWRKQHNKCLEEKKKEKWVSALFFLKKDAKSKRKKQQQHNLTMRKDRKTNVASAFSGALRFQESSWISSLARCALCWTVPSSGASPDFSTRAKAFWTVVSLAPPRRPSAYCSSTGNFSSGIWTQEAELSGAAAIGAWRLRFVIQQLAVNRLCWRAWRFQTAIGKDCCS